MTIPVGAFVEVVNPERADFGKVGRVTCNYRSGGENQAYEIRLWNGELYWIPGLDLIEVEVRRAVRHDGGDLKIHDDAD